MQCFLRARFHSDKKISFVLNLLVAQWNSKDRENCLSRENFLELLKPALLIVSAYIRKGEWTSIEQQTHVPRGFQEKYFWQFLGKSFEHRDILFDYFCRKKEININSIELIAVYFQILKDTPNKFSVQNLKLLGCTVSQNKFSRWGFA